MPRSESHVGRTGELALRLIDRIHGIDGICVNRGRVAQGGCVVMGQRVHYAWVCLLCVPVVWAHVVLVCVTCGRLGFLVGCDGSWRDVGRG